MRIAQCAVSLLLMGFASSPTSEWYVHYERGVRAVERGDPDVAIEELDSALALRSVSGLGVATRPYEYVDYTPHLFLSIAYHMRGDLEQARASLLRAEEAGIAPRSEYGRHLLDAQRVLLTGLASRPLPSPPRLTTYWEQPEILTTEELESLKQSIFESCDGPFGPTEENDQWYVHYERAMDAVEDGRRSDALRSLLEAVALRPEPQRRARTYGMWLVDYYPYFQIARLHAQARNWTCARDALEISKRLNEIDPRSREYNEMMLLDMETDRQVRRDE